MASEATADTSGTRHLHKQSPPTDCRSFLLLLYQAVKPTLSNFPPTWRLHRHRRAEQALIPNRVPRRLELHKGRRGPTPRQLLAVVKSAECSPVRCKKNRNKTIKTRGQKTLRQSHETQALREAEAKAKLFERALWERIRWE
jgi:hypothetical protein